MSRQNPCGSPPAYVTNEKQTGDMQMRTEDARERNGQAEKGQYLAGLKKNTGIRESPSLSMEKNCRRKTGIKYLK